MVGDRRRRGRGRIRCLHDIGRRRGLHALGTTRRSDAMIANFFRGLDFGLGETADALRDTVVRFSNDNIAPRAEEIDRSNKFPRDLWPKLGELGLLGITVEEDFGGAGLGYLEHCVAMEEI